MRRPENQESRGPGYIRAIRTRQRLTEAEAHGLERAVTAVSGARAGLFRTPQPLFMNNTST